MGDFKSIQYSSILEEIQKFFSWQVSVRRWLHQHPELKFQEFETSKFLQEELKKLDIPFTTHWGKLVEPDGKKTEGTGIVAHIGTGKSPCVGIRADMDGLPVRERTDVPFASTNGRMHACGHDSHMTVLLGIARYLKAHEKEIDGTFRLIFQPAEEGGGGAKFMIKEGLLSMDPPTQAVIGLHVSSMHTTGVIHSVPGVLMASANSFRAFVHGKGGHGSMPYRTRDPVSTGAAIIQGVNTYMARRTSVTEVEDMGVISVTAMITQEACNVIPSDIELKGTIRSFDDKKMASLKKALTTIVEKTAEMYDQKGEVTFPELEYPVTANDPKLFRWCEKQIQETPLPGGIQPIKPLLGSEDFSYYALEVPACYFFLGCRPPQSTTTTEMHSDTFYLDEDCLPLGSTFLAYLGRRLLVQLKQTGSFA